jgi:hypothetical protein
LDIQHFKTSSLMSDYSHEEVPMEQSYKDLLDVKIRQSYDLCEWQSSNPNAFKDTEMIHKFYH